MSQIIVDYLQGFAISGGLIVAIGAQNIFVLTQAVRREHAALAALIAMCCDMSLIAVGVFGIGGTIAEYPALQTAATVGGIAFLAWFGWRAFKTSRGNHTLLVGEGTRRSWSKTALIALGVSLLNPHVYLDTVFMIGTLSGTYQGLSRYVFALGAMTASVVWFSLLWLAGLALAPVFRSPKAWKILYLIVCATVWGIAFGLLLQLLEGWR